MVPGTAALNILSCCIGLIILAVTGPPASTPVSILRGPRLRLPDPEATLAPGDRVSLLIPAPE
jgi:hypothetical protein